MFNLHSNLAVLDLQTNVRDRYACSCVFDYVISHMAACLTRA